jgi:hypothetical protein
MLETQFDRPECGTAKINSRIVGGKPADAHAYPWTVALKNGLNQSGTYCTGSLISSRHVLTAAHCVQGQNPSDALDLNKFELAFGMHRQSDGAELLLSVSKAPTIHPQFQRLPYTGSMIYDLALIELDQEVPLSQRIMPICLHPTQILRHDNYDWQYDDLTEDSDDDGSRSYTINKIRKLNEQRSQRRYEQMKQMAQANSSRRNVRQRSSHSDSEQYESLDDTFALHITPLNPMLHNEVDGADHGRMSQLTVAGWGTDDSLQPSRLVDTLKEASVIERPDIWCIDEFGSDAFNSKIQICAHGFGKSIVNETKAATLDYLTNPNRID